MKITFWGAARTVTGSKHLITTDKGKNVLLDCGMFQGMGQDGDILNHKWGFDPEIIDYVIVSHAHIDHTGLLPKLVADGFKGKIYATEATIDLCEIMLLDSAHIQESDLKYVNQRLKEKGKPPVKPLYSIEEATVALSRFVPMPIQKEFVIDDEITVLTTESGHILGSVALNLTIQTNKGPVKLMFSGDIGRASDEILHGPEPFPQADYIICESTYGDRLHAPQPDVARKLLEIVQKTCVEQKGKIIIPAFSVDRTQEIVYALDRLSSEGKLPPIRVYVDSPLSVKATQVMNAHREFFNQEIMQYIAKDGDPFAFPTLTYVQSVEDSKKINDSHEPCIIISASGMAEAGRIKHHIKNNIENPHNTILIVGYASPDSLAGHLRAHDEKVRIFGEYYDVNCGVEVMDNFSAHGDYREMLEYLKCQDPKKVKHLFLVHGEYDTQEAWAEKLKAAGFEHINIPELGDEVEI